MRLRQIDHKFQTPVKNLSVLFLQEFLRRVKGQLLPGLQTEKLTDNLNQAQFIRQSRDLYSTRGTESSFKILFKALYNDEIELIRPQDNLISPSNAQYQLTRDLIVELKRVTQKIYLMLLYSKIQLDQSIKHTLHI